jgi:hypothetical protein
LNVSLAPLALDRDRAYEQIVHVWTSVVDRREMPCPPSLLRTWAATAIANISTLPIPEDKRADAWSMLVWLYCKSLYPDCEGDPLEAMRVPFLTQPP